MVDNVPYRTLAFDGLTIEGYSRAAVQSYWRIPELKLGFDFGAQPWDFMGTGTWFRISHAPGPHRCDSRLCGTSSNDENGSADDLLAGRMLWTA